MTAVLCQRGLGRATLARQYLLDRFAAPAVHVIEHLRGRLSGSRGWHSVTAAASLRRISIRCRMNRVTLTTGDAQNGGYSHPGL